MPKQNPFHETIPLQEASGFFLRLKTASRDPREKDPVYQQLKKLAEEEASDEIDEASAMTPPGGSKADPLQEYLKNEFMGRKAEEAASTDYYVQRLRETAAELQQAQSQLGDLSEQHQVAQEQLSGVDGQMQASQQEGQLAQQAALQQVQQANDSANQAMQEAVAAQGQILEAKAETVRRTQALQQFSQQLLDLATAAAGAAAPTMTSEEQMAAGVDPTAGDPAAAAGQVPTDPSQDPAAAASGQVPGVEGQPGAESAASQVPAEGGGGQEAAGSSEDGEKKRDGQVSIKVGTAALAAASSGPKRGINPKLIGALLGAGLFGGTQLHTALGGKSVEERQANISQLESQDPSIGGDLKILGQRLGLANKQFSEKHPVLSAGTMTLSGANIGSDAADQIHKSLIQAAAEMAKMRAQKGA